MATLNGSGVSPSRWESLVSVTTAAKGGMLQSAPAQMGLPELALGPFPRVSGIEKLPCSLISASSPESLDPCPEPRGKHHLSTSHPDAHRRPLGIFLIKTKACGRRPCSAGFKAQTVGAVSLPFLL